MKCIIYPDYFQSIQKQIKLKSIRCKSLAYNNTFPEALRTGDIWR